MSNATFPGLTHYMPPVLGIHTPISNFGQNIINVQGTMCDQFELNFYRCCEAFGLVASKRKCDLEYRDLLECVYQNKQTARFHVMQKERTKQFLEGKLDRPWVKDPPKLFEMQPDFYKHENIQPTRIF